jgi:hexosaminidase
MHRCLSAWSRQYILLAVAIALVSGSAGAETTSPLAARGYTVLPVPQHVKLGERDFHFGQDWRLRLGAGVPQTDVAVESLKEQLGSRFHIALAGQGAASALELAVQPNSIAVSDTTDRDRAAIAEQAYKIELAPDRIRIWFSC